MSKIWFITPKDLSVDEDMAEFCDIIEADTQWEAFVKYYYKRPAEWQLLLNNDHEWEPSVNMGAWEDFFFDDEDKYVFDEYGNARYSPEKITDLFYHNVNEFFRDHPQFIKEVTQLFNQKIDAKDLSLELKDYVILEKHKKDGLQLSGVAVVDITEKIAQIVSKGARV